MKEKIKILTLFVAVLLIRLIPFRAPNVEPVMATLMPISKNYSRSLTFLFGALSVILFDLITFKLGIWTLITAISYGLVGIGATFYFKNRSGWRNYATYAFIATIFYDALTGLTIGPLFFNQSFTASFIGQVPFTIIHLLGNVSFAILLSPLIERWVAKKNIAESSAYIIRTVEV